MGVEAFVPTSVTTVFAPREESDAGSLGVSFALEAGVHVDVEQADQTTIILGGEPTGIEPVSNLLDTLGVTATVTVDSTAPIGCGFGVSGATTLGTALAANEALDLDHPRGDLVEAVHHAELAAGTGQGDVFIQDQGGLVYNTGDGIGRVPRTDTIAYSSFGALETAAVLGDAQATERISEAGRAALASFDPQVALADWFDVSWEFAEATDLVSDQVRDTVAALEAAGGAGTMAMIGETVIGTPEVNILETETAITPDGAHLV